MTGNIRAGTGKGGKDVEEITVQPQELDVIPAGDRKSVSRRRKINWRAMYKKAMRRVWVIGVAAYLSVILNVIQAVIIYILQAGPI